MSDEQPTLWELQRTIASSYAEVQKDIEALAARLDHFVLKEVYNAHRAADQERIGRLEAEVQALRESNRRAMWTAVTSFIAPVVVALVLAWMLRGGGAA
ncbi:hypothetical protein [Streptomonospora litoralis]|uniref:Uncharacterized protein n=1 Tax=Streptomonospora litoralis TaxID=2498135 RepID=A0A4P6Q3Y8_9ACTN|nr:hypothetical protein [Streptomonospora litoralis]QBI53417.1 hypothetical protein EKD16_08115 [Streptomonospora litoralis]